MSPRRAARTTTEPRWLDAREQSAWRGYIESIHELEEVLERDLVPHGLTMGDYEVLVQLSEAPERQLRMCDLACDLRLSPSGLTRRLDGLVRGGLVRREPSPSDRRVMLATLTPAGLEAIERAAPDHVAGVRRHFLAHIADDELDVLARVFARVRAGIEHAGAP